VLINQHPTGAQSATRKMLKTLPRLRRQHNSLIIADEIYDSWDSGWGS